MPAEERGLSSRPTQDVVRDLEIGQPSNPFGRLYSPVTGKARLGQRPSQKSIKRMVERVHALTAERLLGRRPQGWWIG